ncbi:MULTISPECIES: hypothetical protein [unclassified Nonomuraea]
MSFWKKIGIALVAAVVVLFVALVVAVFVPGGWKFSLVLVGLPALAGWIWWQWLMESHPADRRDDVPPPGSRWDERTERWQYPDRP